MVLRFARRGSYNLTEAQRLELSRPIVWDLSADRWIPLSLESSSEVEGIGFTSDGATVWAYAGGRIEEFDSTTGGRRRTVEVESPFRRLLTVSPDGRRLAVGLWESQVQVVDRRTGTVVSPQMDHQARAKVERASFSGDGARLLTVSDEQVRVWSVETGDLLAPPFVHDVRVNDAALDRQGRTIAISVYPRRDGWAGEPSWIYFWSLDEETSPVKRLRTQAMLASGHKVDSVGGFVPLGSDELREIWVKFVEGGGVTDKGEHVALWDRQQAGTGDPYGRRFHERQLVVHLGRRIAADTSVPELYEERADLLMRLDRMEEALADLSKLVELDPRSVRRYTERARLLRRMRRAEEAMADFDTALELAPDNRDLRRIRGQYYAELGHLDSAVADLRQAFDLDGDTAPKGTEWTSVRDVFQLAFLALKADDQVTYEESCGRALLLLAAVPRDAPATVEQWNALFFAAWACVLGEPGSLGESDWTSLTALLETFTNGSDRRVGDDVSLLLGAVRLRMGDLQRAEAHLSAIDMPPYDQLFLADVFVHQGRAEEAATLLAVGCKSVQALRERQVDRGEVSQILEPWWPEDAELAELLAAKVKGSKSASACSL